MSRYLERHKVDLIIFQLPEGHSSSGYQLELYYPDNTCTRKAWLDYSSILEELGLKIVREELREAPLCIKKMPELSELSDTDKRSQQDLKNLVEGHNLILENWRSFVENYSY
jgi:hypothetical protein